MKIFIIGTGPLPDDTKDIRNAGGLRTSQFLETLKKIKTKRLVALQLNTKDSKISETKNGYLNIPKNTKNIYGELLKKLVKFKPDIVIGINTYPSFLAAKLTQKLRILLDKNICFWADLNGWAMAEGQAQAAKLESDAFLPMLYKMEKKILLNADKISVVSTPQKFAILGELAANGRQIKDNFKYQFVEVIPNATKILKNDKAIKENLFRNKIDKDAFVVAQVGGFNAWLDEETLFKALENAMKKNENIHFVCTGGSIKNIDEKTFTLFKNRILKSKFKDNFHLLGWIKTELIPNVYKESDCIINADFDCLETQTGARNRLNEALKFGLPIVTTVGSEIANQLLDNNAAIGTENGNWQKLSNEILQLSKDKKLRIKLIKNGKDLLRNKFSVKITTEPLIAWLKDPKCAPAKKININNLNYLSASKLFLKNRGLKEFIKKICSKFI